MKSIVQNLAATENPVFSSFRDDEDFRELLEDLIAEIPEKITRIQLALSTSDWPSLRTVGHQWKGCGGGYGFEGLTALGADLEHAAINGDCCLIETAVAALIDHLSRIRL